MPELPEVETTRRGIQPHLTHQVISQCHIRHPQLRWPIPTSLKETLPHARIQHIHRRAKYLLLLFDHGTLIVHLGMSGRLRMLPKWIKPEKHDHFDLLLENNTCLRYTDPRRFGAILWTADDPLQHPLLHKLGPEPLSKQFNGQALYHALSKRHIPIKTGIMDHHVVVGVGNIYANEALFLSGISPLQPCHQVTLAQCFTLAKHIKQVLRQAIAAGGTTLKDFYGVEGNPGWFSQQLQVYQREHQSCLQCATPIKRMSIAQRSTFYCPHCQLLLTQ